MAQFKIEKLILGAGDLTQTSAQSVFRASNSNPTPSDGSDGDIWVKVLGINSDILIKVNGQWQSLLNKPLSTTLNDNTTGGIALSFPAIAFNAMTIEFVATRGSNKRQGILKIVNNGTIGPTGASLVEYADNDLGPSNIGINFNAQVDISGSVVQVMYDTDSQGSNASLTYTLKGFAG